MSAQGTAWAVVAAALGASIITGAISFWLEVWRERRIARQQKAASLTAACERVISSAMRLAVRSSGLRETMILRSGFSEALDIMLHHREPLDTLALNDWLTADAGPMLDAQSTIWLSGNSILIKGAAAVVFATIEVMTTATKLTESQRPLEIRKGTDLFRAAVRRLKPLPRDPGVEHMEAVRKMAHACREFACLMRVELKAPDPEAILRSFPDQGQSG